LYCTWFNRGTTRYEHGRENADDHGKISPINRINGDVLVFKDLLASYDAGMKLYGINTKGNQIYL
jgi:hypothetical protein